jgi:hypothetical protein
MFDDILSVTKTGRSGLEGDTLTNYGPLCHSYSKAGNRKQPYNRMVLVLAANE